MTVDLRAFIEDDQAAKDGGFTGAVFLTYTLNLTFFEQIIAPALDRANCANVLIIVDPDGYAEAIQMGNRTITGVGLRYVCMPLPRTGRGVQHAKMLFMAGPKHGRLLIGSGNLTYHGYGRNLELYSCFDFDNDNPEPEALYAMQKAWDLIQRIKLLGGMPPVAINQINEIKSKAIWLSNESNEILDFQVWDNVERPIWSQLQDWRRQAGFGSEPIHSLLMISPFFDKDASAVRHISSELSPNQIQIIVDPASTNLNGSALSHGLEEFNLQLNGIKASIGEDSDSQKRPLHAKAMIGIEKQGAWCISGSANMTRPALMESWRTSGNLELVTFRWSKDQNAFIYVLEDPGVQTWPIQIESFIGAVDAPSDQPKPNFSRFFIEYLTVHGEELNGKVNQMSTELTAAGRLHFLRGGHKASILINGDGKFRLVLPSKLNEAEAACLEMDELTTPYRWIDQPDLLARYGDRSYQSRTQQKLQTFDGAGKLLEELFNFLWDRTDPELIPEQQVSPSSHHRQDKNSERDDKEIPEAPPPSDFVITEHELLNFLNRHVQKQSPYDRSTWNLRDLLSIVLIRLTTPTTKNDETTGSGDEPDENSEDHPNELDDRGKEAISRKRLRDYVVQYCRKYGRRLVEQDFLLKTTPTLLFENHFTLGRVLLELASKEHRFPEFTTKDFQECIWWLWAPLVWPSIVGLTGKSTITQLGMRFTSEEIRASWSDCEISSLIVPMFYRAFGNLPHWKEGIRNNRLAAAHLLIKELFQMMVKQIDLSALEVNENGIREVMGFQSQLDLPANDGNASSRKVERYKKYLETVNYYCSPAEERLKPILTLAANQGKDRELYLSLLPFIEENGLIDEWKAYQQNPKRIRAIFTDEDDEGEVYCVCGGALTKSSVDQLRRGKLVLCTQTRDTWLYQIVKVPFIATPIITHKG